MQELVNFNRFSCYTYEILVSTNCQYNKCMLRRVLLIAHGSQVAVPMDLWFLEIFESKLIRDMLLEVLSEGPLFTDRKFVFKFVRI